MSKRSKRRKNRIPGIGGHPQGEEGYTGKPSRGMHYDPKQGIIPDEWVPASGGGATGPIPDTKTVDSVKKGALDKVKAGGKKAKEALKGAKWLKVAGGISAALLALDMLDTLHNITLGERGREQDMLRENEAAGEMLRRGVVEGYEEEADIANERDMMFNQIASGGMQGAAEARSQGDLASLVMGHENMLRQIAVQDQPNVLDYLVSGRF